MEHHKDGDGKLSTEERKAAGEARKAEFLKKFDKDGDGKISAEEKKAIAEQWKTRRGDHGRRPHPGKRPHPPKGGKPEAGKPHPGKKLHPGKKIRPSKGKKHGKKPAKKKVIFNSLCECDKTCGCSVLSCTCASFYLQK